MEEISEELLSKELFEEGMLLKNPRLTIVISEISSINVS